MTSTDLAELTIIDKLHISSLTGRPVMAGSGTRLPPLARQPPPPATPERPALDRPAAER